MGADITHKTKVTLFSRMKIASAQKNNFEHALTSIHKFSKQTLINNSSEFVLNLQ